MKESQNIMKMIMDGVKSRSSIQISWILEYGKHFDRILLRKEIALYIVITIFLENFCYSETGESNPTH